MTEAACHPVIDRWHLAADGAPYRAGLVRRPAGRRASHNLSIIERLSLDERLILLF